MNRKLSQRLLIAEAVVLALPATALLALGLATISVSAAEDPWMAADLVTVLAAASTIAGWWLIVKAVRGGAEALQTTHRGWWLAASVGALLVITAVVSMLLPPSPEYTPAALFREHLESCILGAPLVVVLGHLWAEAKFRKTANKSHATCADARA